MSKILLIDDEEANVRVLSMSLRSDGHEVLSATSGEEGLEVFRKEKPAPACLSCGKGSSHHPRRRNTRLRVRMNLKSNRIMRMMRQVILP